MKIIKYGVSHNNIIYGWLEKELYRLPVKIGNRYYGFKKLAKIEIGRKYGYKLSQKPFTEAQLIDMTVLLSEPYTLTQIKHKDVPF